MQRQGVLESADGSCHVAEGGNHVGEGLLEREEARLGPGFIEDFEVEKTSIPAVLTIQLRYDENRDPVITGLKRVSRPGLRQYVSCESIPTVRNGLGCAILSTSRGVMSDREARRQRVGGELVCTVW